MGPNSKIPITLKTVKAPSPSVIEKHSRQLKGDPGGWQVEMKMVDDCTEEETHYQKGLIALGKIDGLRNGRFKKLLNNQTIHVHNRSAPVLREQCASLP